MVSTDETFIDFAGGAAATSFLAELALTVLAVTGEVAGVGETGCWPAGLAALTLAGTVFLAAVTTGGDAGEDSALTLTFWAEAAFLAGVLGFSD